MTSLLEEAVGTAVDEPRGLMGELQGSSSNLSTSVDNPARASPKRKRAEKVPTGSVPESAQALAKVRPVYT